MEFKFKGKVTGIGSVKEGKSQSGTDWATRNIKVEEEGAEYPQSAIFKIFKTKENTKYVNELGYKVGDTVEVEFNLKVNAFKTKAGKNMETTEVSAWKVTKLESGVNESSVSDIADGPMDLEGEDDLPF